MNINHSLKKVKKYTKNDFLGKSFKTEKGLFTITVIITFSNKPLEMLLKDEKNQTYLAEADENSLNTEKIVYELRKITDEYYQKLYDWMIHGIPFNETSDTAIEDKPIYQIQSYLSVKKIPDKIILL